MRKLQRVGIVCLVAALLAGCGSDPKSGTPGAAPKGLVGGKPAPALQALSAQYLAPRIPNPPVPAPKLIAFSPATGGPAPSRTAFQGLEGAVSALVFTPDSRFLITASYDDFNLRVWTVGTGKQVSSQKAENRPTGLALTPDAQTVIIADVYENLTFLPLDHMGKLDPGIKVEAHLGHVPYLTISPNGLLLAAASFDKKLTLWDVKTREKIQTVETEEGLRGVGFSPDGKFLAAGSTTNLFILWNLESGEGRKMVVPRVGPDTETWQVGFSPDGSLFSTAHTQPYLTVWETQGWKYRHFCNGPMASVMAMAMAYSPDGKTLASAWGDHKIYLWAPDNAQTPQAVLEGHQANATCLAFNSDGSLLASAGEDKQLFLWKAAGASLAKAAPAADQSDPRIVAAKAALAKLIQAAKNGNLEEARKYITQNKWKAMEAENQVQMMLGMLAQMEELEGRVEGTSVILGKKLAEELDGGGRMTMSISIPMVQEEGQWKAGP